MNILLRKNYLSIILSLNTAINFYPFANIHYDFTKNNILKKLLYMLTVDYCSSF